jgi:hypothetical protein
MKTYVGVDPGHTGCVAFYTVHEDGLSELRLVDLQIKMEEEKTFRKFTKMQIAMENVVKQIQMMIDLYGKPELAVIEAPASRKNEGVVGAFTFGKNCGLIEGIFYGNNVKVLQVVPSVWKGLMGLSRVKSQSCDKAKKLFENTLIHGGPEMFEKPKMLADGRAEAACMAWYAAKIMKTGEINE